MHQGCGLDPQSECIQESTNEPWLVGVAQWIEVWPANQRVAGSIPSQGTYLSCGQIPVEGA